MVGEGVRHLTPLPDRCAAHLDIPCGHFVAVRQAGDIWLRLGCGQRLTVAGLAADVVLSIWSRNPMVDK